MTTRGMYLIGMLVLLFLANIFMLMGMTNWPTRVREGFAAHMGSGAAPEPMANIPPYSGLASGGGSLEQGIRYREGSNARTVNEFFADAGSGAAPALESMDNIPPYSGLTYGGGDLKQGVRYREGSNARTVNEYFTDALVPGSFGTAPIGTYDGLNMAAGLPPAAQGFRANHPDVPLAGPPVEVGPDNLFIFKNNQCKPECCGATLSCDGGCVCTTPEQRDFINTRGGNRKHDDGF